MPAVYNSLYKIGRRGYNGLYWQCIVDLYNRMEALPGDLFSVKSAYLVNLCRINNGDIDSAVVILGKSGERLAKGTLGHYRVPHENTASFDTLLRLLARVSPSPVLIVGLRTVRKYR